MTGRKDICRYDWEGEGFKCHVLGWHVSLTRVQKWSSESYSHTVKSYSHTVNIYGQEQSEGEFSFGRMPGAF